MKYLVLVDYMAFKGNNGFDFIEIEAKSETDAILTADHMMNDEIYLLKLMKKTGKIEKIDSFKVTTYTSFLVRRRHNWHASDKDGENVTTIKKYVNKYGPIYDFA